MTPELLREIFAALPAAVSVFDAEHRLVLASDVIFRWHGLEPSVAPPGTKLAEMLRVLACNGAYGPGDPEQLAQALLAMDRTRPSTRLARSHSGRVRLVESRPLASGGFLTCTTDVSALSQAEAASAARAGLLEIVLARLQAGVAVFDPETRLTLSNPAYEGLIGLSTGSIHVGMTHRDILHLLTERGEMTTEEAAQIEARRIIGRFQTGSRQRIRPNGEVLRVGSQPLPPGGFMIEVDDITALKRAEDEATRRAAVLEAMQGSIRHGICMYGPDHRLLTTNSRTEAMLRLTPGFMKPGLPVGDLLDEQARRGEISAEAAAHAKANDRSKSYRYHRSSGDGRMLEIASDPMADGGFVMTFSDVTEEYRIRAELEAARSAAEAASEAKSRFLATMSHELRTPLNAVIGFSEALAGEQDRKRLADYAGSINEAGRRLLLLIDDILDVARSQTGTLRVSKAPVAIGPLLRAAGDAVAEDARLAGLTLVLDVPAGLPSLMGDAGRLRQLLVNLLSNAAKFTPTGGRITLSAKVVPEGLAIRVADTGIGIAPEDRERVFEPFTQVDNSLSRRFQGSGLGLYLARTLAEASGGTVALDAPQGPASGTNTGSASGPTSGPTSGTVAVLRFPADMLIYTADQGGTPDGAA